MAEVVGGSQQSVEVARMLAKSVRAVAPSRSRPIRSEMVYGFAPDDIAFTSPSFDRYLEPDMPIHQRSTMGRGR